MNPQQISDQQQHEALRTVADAPVLWSCRQRGSSVASPIAAIRGEEEAAPRLPDHIRHLYENRRESIERILRTVDGTPAHRWAEQHRSRLIEAVNSIPAPAWESGQPAVLALPAAALHLIEGAELHIPAEGLQIRCWDALGDDTAALITSDGTHSLLVHLAPDHIPAQHLRLYERIRTSGWDSSTSEELCHAIC